jgi:hypothetical protein
LLTLLSEQDRLVITPWVGTYVCDGQGHWLELHFTGTGVAEVARRLDEIEQRLAAIEERLCHDSSVAQG